WLCPGNQSHRQGRSTLLLDQGQSSAVADLAVACQCPLGPHVPVGPWRHAIRYDADAVSRRDKTHEKLQVRLGYRFAKPDLLEQALTHSSAVSPGKRIERSYQRLEFLGDRVLGLVVADMLYRHYPQSNEGDLSRTLNTLVRKET